MSKVTPLATAQITATDTLTIELVEANETPAVVIVRWPAKPSVLHPHRFPAVAEIAARVFAAAVVKLHYRRHQAPGTGSTRARPRGARPWAARRAAVSSARVGARPR